MLFYFLQHWVVTDNLICVFFLYTGKGNRPGAEFNFFSDAEAAYIVLQEYTCPITVVPLDACMYNGLSWVCMKIKKQEIN